MTIKVSMNLNMVVGVLERAQPLFQEIFNGEIEQTLSNEDKADFIIKQINIFFASKMIGKMGGQ